MLGRTMDVVKNLLCLSEWRTDTNKLYSSHHCKLVTVVQSVHCDMTFNFIITLLPHDYVCH